MNAKACFFGISFILVVNIVRINIPFLFRNLSTIVETTKSIKTSACKQLKTASPLLGMCESIFWINVGKYVLTWEIRRAYFLGSKQVDFWLVVLKINISRFNLDLFACYNNHAFVCRESWLKMWKASTIQRIVFKEIWGKTFDAKRSNFTQIPVKPWTTKMLS